jgi:hypothetical protein
MLGVAQFQMSDTALADDPEVCDSYVVMKVSKSTKCLPIAGEITYSRIDLIIILFTLVLKVCNSYSETARFNKFDRTQYTVQ